MICCEVCGNETPPGSCRCPFCEAEMEAVPTSAKGVLHKVVSLKQGMPTVAQALARLDRELAQARLERCRVLTFVHGYGSSGEGGVIRKEVRVRLQYLKYQGSISDMVLGEEFSTRSGPGRNLLRRFPLLRRHGDLNRGNQGITLVAL